MVFYKQRQTFEPSASWVFSVGKANCFQGLVPVILLVGSSLILGPCVWGTQAHAAEMIVDYKRKTVTVFSEPEVRAQSFSQSDLPALPAEILERRDPYLKIMDRNNRAIWVLKGSVAIAGGGKALPKGYRSSKPCLTKTKSGMGSGNNC